MGLINIIRSVLRRSPAPGTSPLGASTTSSRAMAKSRLGLTVVSDRAGISPRLLESLRQDIGRTVATYADVNTDELELRFDLTRRNPALVAVIPLTSLKEQWQSSSDMGG
jgi:cell division topological specificity factor